MKQHDEVFIRGENDFFTIDDFEQHPNYFSVAEKGGAFHDYEAEQEELVRWYASLFEDARADQCVGDYSTNYFASRKAPRRIRKLLPECKLVFMLRDPVERTYSEYWHHLKRGRVTRPFEKAIQFNPRTFIKNSCYAEAAQRYLRFFSREQVHFVVFEEFVQDTQAVVDEVFAFLGLAKRVDVSQVDTRRNVARVPRWPSLQRLANRVFQQTVRRRGDHHASRSCRGISLRSRLKTSLEGRFRVFNLRKRGKPPMSGRARDFLEKLLEKENRGISDVIHINVKRYWTYM